MKKMNHKKTAGILAALLLLATLLIPYRSVLGAPTGSARFSGTDVTLNIGDTFSIGWAISASENVLLEATFSVSPGLTVTGPITCAQGINGGTSANKVLDYSGSFAAFSGNITVRADQAGQFTVQMTEVTLVSANDSSSVTINSPAFTVYVRTKEQTEASIAEQERIRREQEAEASRQQSEAQSRAESISASASEEERRRKESEDAAYREWARQSSIEASIAASIAAEEAAKSRAESEREASISASESEVEASISASESEREASISASESEVERTRPTEIKDLGFVRYTYGGDADEDGEGDEVFYFVTEGSDVSWPEGAKPISMRLNDVNVLALRMDGMASNTYLVYGMRKEHDVPSWEFWHRSTGQFFRYDYLNSNTHFVEPSTERPATETEPSTTRKSETQAPQKTEPPIGPTLPIDPSGGRISLRDMIFLVIAGAIGGAAVTALIFVLVLKGRKKGGAEDAEEASSETVASASVAQAQEAPEEAKEKTGDTDAVDLD